MAQYGPEYPQLQEGGVVKCEEQGWNLAIFSGKQAEIWDFRLFHGEYGQIPGLDEAFSPDMALLTSA